MEFLVVKKKSFKTLCDIMGFLMECTMTTCPAGPLRTNRETHYPKLCK